MCWRSGVLHPSMTSRRMAFSADGVLMESSHAQHARQLCSSFGWERGASIHRLTNIDNSFLLNIHLEETLRLSPTIPPLQLPPNVLFTIFYYLPPKDSSPYNSFSPTIPPISIPSIYDHSLTNYYLTFLNLKKSYSICTAIIHIIIVLRGSNEINIAKKQCD